MNKIALIIKREYLSRVRKKSFIIMSIIGPLLFGCLIIIPIWLTASGNEEKVVKVVDDSGYFVDKLTDDKNIRFEFLDSSLDSALIDLSKSKNWTLLHIPEISIDQPQGILLYSQSSFGFEFERNLERAIQKEIEQIRMERSGISQAKLDAIKNRIEIKYVNPESSNQETNSGVASVIGYFTAFAIYMFIFIYGAQVMRGVAEEKTNRIVEIIISSVKPFQLMTGKIVGIALVVLTQLSIWIVFTSLIYMAITGYYAEETRMLATESQEVATNPSAKIEQAKMLGDMVSGISGIPMFKLIFSFIFYFLGGYLLYAALFAMIGGAVDSMEDSQQFMLPITVPLIASIVVLAAVLQEPHGKLAIWMSMIPLTSPVVMMMRVPFDVPVIQLIISMLLLVIGFVCTTWIAGRVYRVGILMHGTKVNYRILWKWFFMRN